MVSLEQKRREVLRRDAEKIKEYIFGRFPFCLVCGSKEILLDHIIPLFLGGTNDKSNLQSLCYDCNTKKRLQSIDYRFPFLTAEEKSAELGRVKKIQPEIYFLFRRGVVKQWKDIEIAKPLPPKPPVTASCLAVFFTGDKYRCSSAVHKEGLCKLHYRTAVFTNIISDSEVKQLQCNYFTFRQCGSLKHSGNSYCSQHSKPKYAETRTVTA